MIDPGAFAIGSVSSSVKPFRSGGTSRFAFRMEGLPGSSIGMMCQDAECGLSWSTPQGAAAGRRV